MTDREELTEGEHPQDLLDILEELDDEAKQAKHMIDLEAKYFKKIATDNFYAARCEKLMKELRDGE